jgi:hypothetical protein
MSMRRIASIGLAIGALTAALPVQAEDQSAYFANGAMGGGWRQHGAVRVGPSVQISPERYGGYAYGGYGYGDYAYGSNGSYPYAAYTPYEAYGPQSCTYVGGPKSSLGWTCW